jgi:hypothetical protein
MTAALTTALPGSRTLLGWWRELAAWQPQGLWLGHLLLHRVEALVEVAHRRRLDRLRQAVLRAHSLSGPLTALHLEPQVLARLARELAGEGLLAQGAADRPSPTPAGRQALEGGAYVARTRERRAFYFVDNSSLHRPPHFVPLEPRGLSSPCAGEWHFDAALLGECVRQTPEWKSRYRFPAEVEAVLGPTPGEPDWRRVIVDRPEQLLLALVRASGGADGPTLLGFPVRAEGWVLDHETPVLSLGGGWQEAFPDLAEDAPPEAWRQAWLAWCQPRSLPQAEAEACRLERSGHRLRVRAPQRLVERLKSLRSDAMKNETWLLAGSGRSRAAAQVSIEPGTARE